jgi:surfactin synthase thioesterase subunit
MQSETKASWWITHRANPAAAVRLICFPYAGGTASVFRTWHRDLPEEVELCSIQTPGRANRLTEPPFTRLPVLVETLAPVLLPLLDRPFVIYGHSLGAVVGFEVARWLRTHGCPLPERLIVSGRRAPHIPYTGPRLHSLNDDDFVASIARLNGIAKEVMADKDILRLTLPSLRADIEMLEMYEYRDQPPLGFPIAAQAGSSDLDEPPESVREWRRQTAGAFSFHVMAGGHFFIQANQDQFLKSLRSELSPVLFGTGAPAASSQAR